MSRRADTTDRPDVRCPLCGGEQVVRAGRRQLVDGVRQLWRCHDCGKRFSKLERGDKRTPGNVVLMGLTLWCEGYSLEETAFILSRKYGVRRSRGCICKWLADFDPSYRAIRRLNATRRPVVRNHLFHHRGLSYEYQVHLPKLRFARKFGGLQTFLESIPDCVPAGVFEDGMRCSEHPVEVALHHARHQRWNWLTTQAAQALRLARHNRERHAVIERYFLSCDRNTVATEVPVWFYDKRLGATVTGHIDVLMANFGKLWVLDYKPRAAKENPAKVASQLALYAQALVYRAGVNRQDIRCAWFDDRDCFAFAP